MRRNTYILSSMILDSYNSSMFQVPTYISMIRLTSGEHSWDDHGMIDCLPGTIVHPTVGQLVESTSSLHDVITLAVPQAQSM